MNTGALPPGETRKYGTLVAPRLYAPNHQHFFNVRLDMMVDGPANSVYEVHTVAEPPGPENPHGNAFYAESTLLKTEQEAQQSIDPLSARYWKIVNPRCSNGLGQPVAYKLAPGENARSFVAADAFVRQRAGFMGKHLWVTPYDPAELYAAGDYPNQHPGGAGLPAYTAADRPIEDTRPRRLVHDGPSPHPAPGGLAGDARLADRLHAQAARLLRPQPGARRAAGDGARRVLP